jgi:hypothetical protein
MRSYANQVGSHPQGIQGQSHFGARLVCPIHRNFRYVVAPSSCHHQDFDVEAESVHPHTGEKVLGYRGAEQLETALRVLDTSIGE